MNMVLLSPGHKTRTMASRLSVSKVAAEWHKHEFGQLCDRREWERPSFWFTPANRKRPRARLDDCREWLAREMAGPKRFAKDVYAREAWKQFGVPPYRFNQLWSSMAEGEWREPGRPRKIRS